MAFDKRLDALFPGATSDGNEITIPIASIPGLKASDVADNPTPGDQSGTGDWREFGFNFLNHLNDYLAGLVEADIPQYFACTKTGNYVSGNTFSYTYTINLQALSAEEDVVPEG
jgi:hypothetical protein